jgi:hypothetical protein
MGAHRTRRNRDVATFSASVVHKGCSLKTMNWRKQDREKEEAQWLAVPVYTIHFGLQFRIKEHNLCHPIEF